jgi:hypothetical protein
VLPALALVFRIIAEVDEGVVALRRHHDDIAATTAVATRGAAARHKLFAPEGHTSVAAIAGFYFDSCFIDEHGEPVISNQLSMVNATKARHLSRY